MKPRLALAAALVGLALTFAGAQAPPPAVQAAFPPRGAWPAAEAAAVGFNKLRLDAAVAFAVANYNDIIVVVRWLGGGTRVLDEFLGKVLAALEP